MSKKLLSLFALVAVMCMVFAGAAFATDDTVDADAYAGTDPINNEKSASDGVKLYYLSTLGDSDPLYFGINLNVPTESQASYTDSKWGLYFGDDISNNIADDGDTSVTVGTASDLRFNITGANKSKTAYKFNAFDSNGVVSDSNAKEITVAPTEITVSVTPGTVRITSGDASDNEEAKITVTGGTALTAITATISGGTGIGLEAGSSTVASDKITLKPSTKFTTGKETITVAITALEVDGVKVALPSSATVTFEVSVDEAPVPTIGKISPANVSYVLSSDNAPEFELKDVATVNQVEYQLNTGAKAVMNTASYDLDKSSNPTKIAIIDTDYLNTLVSGDKLNIFVTANSVATNPESVTINVQAAPPAGDGPKISPASVDYQLKGGTAPVFTLTGITSVDKVQYEMNNDNVFININPDHYVISDPVGTLTFKTEYLDALCDHDDKLKIYVTANGGKATTPEFVMINAYAAPGHTPVFEENNSLTISKTVADKDIFLKIKNATRQPSTVRQVSSGLTTDLVSGQYTCDLSGNFMLSYENYLKKLSAGTYEVEITIDGTKLTVTLTKQAETGTGPKISPATVDYQLKGGTAPVFTLTGVTSVDKVQYEMNNDNVFININPDHYVISDPVGTLTFKTEYLDALCDHDDKLKIYVTANGGKATTPEFVMINAYAAPGHTPVFEENNSLTIAKTVADKDIFLKIKNATRQPSTVQQVSSGFTTDLVSGQYTCDLSGNFTFSYENYLKKLSAGTYDVEITIQSTKLTVKLTVTGTETDTETQIGIDLDPVTSSDIVVPSGSEIPAGIDNVKVTSTNERPTTGNKVDTLLGNNGKTVSSGLGDLIDGGETITQINIVSTFKLEVDHSGTIAPNATLPVKIENFKRTQKPNRSFVLLLWPQNSPGATKYAQFPAMLQGGVLSATITNVGLFFTENDIIIAEVSMKNTSRGSSGCSVGLGLLAVAGLAALAFHRKK